MTADARIFVAGHRGMVGSAIVRRLESRGYRNIVTRTPQEVDLTCQRAARDLFDSGSFDVVFLAAAKVGGIVANNDYPADFIRDNLAIELNVIHEAWRTGVQRLMFLASSCVYPRHAPQPIAEAALLDGHLEPTNEPYAIAKIAGIKMCESYNRQFGTDFRSVMPSNLYGPNDNFRVEESHVIPALLRRFHEARERRSPSVTVWGSGEVRREFMHVDDLANACVHLAEIPRKAIEESTVPMCSHVNVGTGVDITIQELAEQIGQVVGYRGRIEFDVSRPDGTPRKLLDVSLANKLGWHAEIGLREGLESTYRWFVENSERRRE